MTTPCAEPTRPWIVLVEDDAEIRALVRGYLEANGFLVAAVDGGAALDRLLARGDAPDLVLLDIMLPGEDGLSICRRLRAAGSTPIIMLTAKGDEVDRIVGLELGADDYLPKPFNPRELAARIRAVLRRAQSVVEAPDARRWSVGPLTVDLDAREAWAADGAGLNLTSAEFELLACFIESPNRVLTRDQLMDWTRGRRAEAWDRTIDVQVSRLRKKIERPGDAPLIKTVRSVGYALAAPVRPAEGADA